MTTTNTQQESTESIILRMMREGDKAFLDLLYKKYGAILFKISLGIVKSKEQAEDVLQETLVKIWKNAHRFDGSKAKLITWLVQIAKNTALDSIKSKANQNASVTDTMADKPVIEAYGVSKQNEDFIGLREVIEQKLEKQDQDIVNLLYFQGYTQKEVAEKLMMPLGSVKTRVRLTVNQLRTYLNN